MKVRDVLFIGLMAILICHNFNSNLSEVAVWQFMFMIATLSYFWAKDDGKWKKKYDILSDEIQKKALGQQSELFDKLEEIVNEQKEKEEN